MLHQSPRSVRCSHTSEAIVRNRFARRWISSSEYWRTAKDYTLGATNPVFLDRDGDGRYESPNTIARTLVKSTAGDPAALGTVLGHYDEAVLVQALLLARQQYQADLEQRLRAIAGERGKENEALSRYLKRDDSTTAAEGAQR